MLNPSKTGCQPKRCFLSSSHVTDAPDIFANKEKVQKEVKAFLKESAALACEVASAETQVKWFKDGKPLSSSKKFRTEADGTSRKLVFETVEKRDAGEYSCEAAGQKLTFQVEAVGKHPSCLRGGNSPRGESSHL